MTVVWLRSDGGNLGFRSARGVNLCAPRGVWTNEARIGHRRDARAQPMPMVAFAEQVVATPTPGMLIGAPSRVAGKADGEHGQGPTQGIEGSVGEVRHSCVCPAARRCL